MSATYYELVRHADEMEDSYDHQRARKATLVGKPLLYSGEFFKIIFSIVFGFEWFIKFSYRFELPVFSISLPAPMYLLGYASDLLGGLLPPNIMRIALSSGNPLISQFAMGAISYEVTPINFWAIPFNYIARNTGKVTGWILVSLFTVPANLAIKAYYGIKRSILNFKINRGLKALKPVDIVGNWLEASSNSRVNNFSADTIAKYVDTNDFFTGLMAYHDKELSKAIQNNSYEISVPKESHNKGLSEYYYEARNKVLVNEQRWALASTILSGVLIFPLIFTISAYKKLTLRQSEEKRNLQNVKENVLDKFSGRMFIYEYSQAVYYIQGKKLLDEEKPDLAYNYFSKVSEGSEQYQDAMIECGSWLLMAGNYNLANEYFQKAGNERFANITQLLMSNSAATVADVAAIKKDVVAYTPLSPASIIGNIGVLANQSSSDSAEEKKPEIGGLDESDDEAPSPCSLNGSRRGNDG